MDRELNPRERRRAFWKSTALAVPILLAVSAFLIWASDSMRPSLSLSRLRVARVDTGTIESTIAASGLVEPEIEHVISSPADSRVLRVLKYPGASVRRGDAILELDTNQLQLTLEKHEQQIGLKRNDLEKARLDLANTLSTLQNQVGTKQLELEAARSQTARTHALFLENLISQAQLDQALLAEKKTEFELKELQERIRFSEKSTEVQYAGLEMALRILEKERKEAHRELTLATTTSDRDGVLTWVFQEEGSSIRRGDVLARVADLRAFRVKVTVSDIHSSRLSEGLPAQVRIGETILPARVRQIFPTITNGIISLVLQLEDPSNPILKSNLRVDAEIVLQKKRRVLRMHRGPGIEPEGPRQLFVIRGDRAIRTTVELGVAGFDNCEILGGLFEGDEVLLTDMKDYLHLTEIRLRK